MAIPNESDKWVLTPEGYAVPDGEGWKRYVYVRDVQGNIRAVVGENNAVAEQTDYYPYRLRGAQARLRPRTLHLSRPPLRADARNLPLRLLRRRPRQLHRPNGNDCH